MESGIPVAINLNPKVNYGSGIGKIYVDLSNLITDSDGNQYAITNKSYGVASDNLYTDSSDRLYGITEVEATNANDTLIGGTDGNLFEGLDSCHL